jgi:hypothetical protein
MFGFWRAIFLVVDLVAGSVAVALETGRSECRRLRKSVLYTYSDWFPDVRYTEDLWKEIEVVSEPVSGRVLCSVLVLGRVRYLSHSRIIFRAPELHPG